ncbi:hypothetical protein JUNP586_3301 [Acinetobacter baumannii]
MIEIPDAIKFMSKFLTEDLSNGITNKEKDQILKKTLVNFFKDCETIKFSQIINDFKKLNHCVDSELDIYMSKFSYEDIKKRS